MQEQQRVPAARTAQNRSRSGKKLRPKSAKTNSAFRSLKPPSQPKTPGGFSIYVQKSKKLAPATKIQPAKKKKLKKAVPMGFRGGEGVVLNNFFPALDPTA
jgi:hypothetical protein